VGSAVPPVRASARRCCPAVLPALHRHEPARRTSHGGLVALLVGFLSASQPGTAYVHCVGVDPSVRRVGLGAGRYARFFRQALERGASAVTCVTSPGSTRSVACHPGLGFQIDPSPNLHDGVPVQLHHDGPGSIGSPSRARSRRRPGRRPADPSSSTGGGADRGRRIGPTRRRPARRGGSQKEEISVPELPWRRRKGATSVSQWAIQVAGRKRINSVKEMCRAWRCPVVAGVRRRAAEGVTRHPIGLSNMK
jgi:GNAT superfamily N-acetyltransferase